MKEENGKMRLVRWTAMKVKIFIRCVQWEEIKFIPTQAHTTKTHTN